MTHTHFIGIGGAGMSGIARLWALRKGEIVSGSDGNESITLGQLREAGIETWVGHDPSHLAGVDRVIVSTAIREDNPELMGARRLGLPVLHRSQGLAQLAEGFDVVAVAGTHGKTTTSAMVATVLVELGKRPSYVIGGQIIGVDGGQSSAALDSGRAFVIEADESDGSFVHYSPKIAVITNIEPDHLDFYGDEGSYRSAFRDFVAQVSPEGALALCLDDDGARELFTQLRDEGLPALGYGRSEDCDLQVVETQGEDSGTRITVAWRGDITSFRLSALGEHNVMNAAGALLATLALFEQQGESLDVAAIGSALESFQGTRRRFELIGECNGVRVIDDYAHHPTEVAAALHAARLHTKERVVAIFQPHLYTRTQAFAAQFAQALALADVVVIAEIYPAREDPIAGVTGRLIVERIDSGKMGPALDREGAIHFAPTLSDAVAISADITRPGDLVLTIGAGDITTVGPRLLGELADRE